MVVNEPLYQAILRAYADGIFPMADARDTGETYWVEPKTRGIIPLDERFNVPRSLKKFMADCPYTVTRDQAFADVIHACAESPRGDGKGTWINHDIERWFLHLHQHGDAHSVEIWNTDGDLIGGLYGLALNGVFFGESMFSRQTNASKVALVSLVTHLRAQGFTLLDTQFVNPHLKQFGCLEIPQANYLNLLDEALQIKARF